MGDVDWDLSDFKVHRNHPGIILKMQVQMQLGPEILHSNKLPGEARAEVSRTHFA